MSFAIYTSEKFFINMNAISLIVKSKCEYYHDDILIFRPQKFVYSLQKNTIFFINAYKMEPTGFIGM